MNEITKEIIDSITQSFCCNILVFLELENEFMNSGIRNEFDFIKAKFEDNKEELADILDEYFSDGTAEDDLVCGNAEYWRDEFDIYNIEDEMNGDEYEIAHNKLKDIFGI